MGEVLLKELWDGKTPLRLVGIGISQFGPPAGGTIQSSLFDSVREKRLNLEKRIDLLREKFGNDSITPASLLQIRRLKKSFSTKDNLNSSNYEAPFYKSE